MAQLVTDVEWQDFQNLIQVDGHDTFFQGKVIWRRWKYGVDRYMEDGKEDTYEDIELKCLPAYNYFRQWQVNFTMISGDLDKATEALLFSIKYLKELNIPGIFNPTNLWEYDSAKDQFIHNGIIYRAMGDTFLSQAKDKDLMFMIVLQRQETETGTTRGDQSAIDTTINLDLTP